MVKPAFRSFLFDTKLYILIIMTSPGVLFKIVFIKYT